MSTSHTVTQQTSQIASALNHLLPGSQVSVQVMNQQQFESTYPSEHLDSGAGQLFEKRRATFWVALPNDAISVFTVFRGLVPFSDAEREFLTCFTYTLRNLPFGGNRGAELLADVHAFQRILITQYLREGPVHDDFRFWTPGFIIQQLQDLVYKEYEGSPTTSGFIVADHPERFIRHHLPSSCYEFEAFPHTISLEETFFERPTSFLYVDGQGAFYLVDHNQKIWGIIRCVEPNRYNRISKAALEHLEPLLSGKAASAWIGYIGNNNDANILIDKNKHLRWLKSGWYFVDRSHLYHTLEQHGFAASEIENFVAVLLTISDLRRGALILIPNDRDNRPQTSGYIDNSSSGQMLYQMLEGTKVSELRQRPSGLGILTSDGLTTIDMSGRILGCGEIISLENVEAGGQSAGGGRTQAALAASQYGLVVKVSQDGPISLFKKRRRRLHVVL